jgi:2'-5' RNA ligase
VKDKPTARLFVAVDLPALVRERLADWTRTAAASAGVFPGRGGIPRLLGPEAMHLTLCFLGNRPISEMQPLGEAVGTCGRAVGELSLGAPLWLPTRRPRVLAVEVHDTTGELQALKEDVLTALMAACELELQRERRRFRPHVTVARLRERTRPRERRLAPTPALSFLPESLALYRSYLAAEGATYEALTSVALGGPAEI